MASKVCSCRSRIRENSDHISRSIPKSHEFGYDALPSLSFAISGGNES